MKPLALVLKERPDQRLDLSGLAPNLLAGKSAAEIAGIHLETTRNRVTVGDVFRLRMGDPWRIRIEGACDRLDQVGQAMSNVSCVLGGSPLPERNMGSPE